MDPHSTPHTIVVWVDGSLDSAAAVRYASTRAADGRDAVILVASVARTSLVLLEAMQIDTDRLLRDLRVKVETVWGAPVAAAGVKIRTCVARGEGSDVLIDTARRHQPATIVVGAGTAVAGRLLHHHDQLPCSVIAVPSSNEAGATR